MESHKVKITSISHLTHNVLKIVTEKPQQYDFISGQATEISINKEGWTDNKHPFTFTCLPEKDYLEFSIKTYPERKGMTNELLSLHEGDELIVHDVWGTINYKGEGYFIAGGAGVTPFIAILRSLAAKNELGHNKLIFANKTKADIILKEEFEALLGKNFINIISDEETGEYFFGQINESFLKQHINDLKKHVYLCGPEPMMDSIEKQLNNIGMESAMIVKDEF